MIVPLVGSGRQDDAKRPLMVPATIDRKNGLIGFRMIESDDKTKAIVELIYESRQALLDAKGEANRFVTTGLHPSVKAFEFGKATPAEIEIEARKVKKDFSLDHLRPRPGGPETRAVTVPAGGGR